MNQQPRESGPVFVGRMEQVDQIKQYMQEAYQGDPRVCLIRGEAGVGKTHFLKEIESVAEVTGWQVYQGRCFEDLNLPYLPFIESLFPHLEQGLDNPERLYEEDIAIRRLLRRAHPMPSLLMPEQVNQDKLHLFLSVSHAMINLAQQSPSLFVVDDLHWADQLSLDLLAYLAWTLADQVSVPLLILGTHRPVAPEHRLARLVNRFEREPHYRSLVLSGLNEVELRELLKSLGLSRPSHQLLRTIHDVTRGLPLFVYKTIDHLRQKGALQERRGYLVVNRAAVEAVQLPKEIQSAFSTRIRCLSRVDRKILSIAAVLGERFSLEHLELVTNIHTDLLIDALEEGLNQELLVEEEEGFQFAHALIRQLFYKRLSAIRRRRIHLNIAEALEQVDAANLDRSLLNIASHLIEAGQMAASSKLVDYARQAGDRAFSTFAWSDAARYYEAALDAADALDMAPPDRAELHYLAGLSHHRNADIGLVLDHYDRAIDLYRASGCLRGLAQTLVEQTVTGTALSRVPLGTLANLQPLQAALEALGDDAPKLRGRIATMMSQSYRTARQPEAARQMAEEALEIGQSLQDDALCAEAFTSLSLAQLNSMDVQEALKSLQTAMIHADRTTDLRLRSRPLGRLPLSLTLLGKLDEAEDVAWQSAELTTKTQDWGEHSLALSHLVAIAAAKGDFAVAKQRTHETMMMVDRSLYPWSGLRALAALACTHAWLGQVSEAEQALDILVEPGRVFPSPDSVVQGFASVFRLLPRLYAELACEASVACLAERVLSAVSSEPYALAPLCALIEIGDYTHTLALMDTPYQLLSQSFQGGVLFTSGWVFVLPRILGIVEARQQRWDQSASFFLKAIEAASRVGAKPELARSYLDYAQMLTSQDQWRFHHQAMEYVENALAIFHELNMEPFIKRATALIETLQPRPPVLSPSTSPHEGRLSLSEANLLQHAIQEYIKFLR